MNHRDNNIDADLAGCASNTDIGTGEMHSRDTGLEDKYMCGDRQS